MKTILIFSNPFGLGPTGKAISIYKKLSDELENVNIIFCRGKFVSQIIDKRCKQIEVDERNEIEIEHLVEKIKGEVYILSSQNRFAIKVANKRGIPCAFLDGLSWFWRTIPNDHLIADIIFWLNYPGIAKKVPKEHAEKIYLVGGISESSDVKNDDKKGIVIYIGGCKNPLTNLPINYLNLIAKTFSNIELNHEYELVLDKSSSEYLRNHTEFYSKIKRYSHTNFLNKLGQSKLLMTNGGQTATIEAMGIRCPVAFFLPINLSQYSLIKIMSNSKKLIPSSDWRSYYNLPKNFETYEEKDAIVFLDMLSKKLLNNKRKFKLFLSDLSDSLNKDYLFDENNNLSTLGNNGCSDIANNLIKLWKLH